MKTGKPAYQPTRKQHIYTCPFHKPENIHKYTRLLSQSDLISFCLAKNAGQPALQ